MPVLPMLALTLASAVMLARPAAAAVTAEPSPPLAEPLVSYYPHWVSRDGTLTSAILAQLPPRTTIGAHHHSETAELRRILSYPGKQFRVAWYAESNVRESDDVIPVGTPVAARIAEARGKQNELTRQFGVHRFADLVELDASRDKRDGQLTGPSNHRQDWLEDARAVHAAGFRYLAKSLAPRDIAELRSRFGAEFVPHAVFEDVTAAPGTSNPGYRADARAVARTGTRVTLVIHSGAYGGFPGTPLASAQSVVAADFAGPNVEAYWGRPNGFTRIKAFEAAEPPRTASETGRR